ncbi:MAG: DHH family phosphoesterase [Candidatus Tectomicrobia bacterium]|uniref:DHH family phosphoesterase n=1 Tax=Tectimicrobiota bacterium TaxID=2528274 RepID=A0A932MMI1_UNCTE|nr:DHH family phosphoesterase [Candidatus Tectomicrobia bacterium]
MSAGGRFEGVRAFIAARRRFLLLTHVGPDGDGLLSCIALSRYLRSLGKEATAVTEGPVPGFTASYDPEGLVRSREELLAVQDWPSRFDGILVLDTGKPSRLGKLDGPVRESGLPVAVIDHHIAEPDNFDCPSAIDTHAAAVGEMVADFLDEEGYAFGDPLIVRCLHAALVYDTGQFRYTNTSAKTMRWGARLVELGANPGEAYSIFWESHGAGSVRLMGLLMGRMKLECGGRLAWFTLGQEELDRYGVRRDETDEYISLPRGIQSVEVVAFMSEIEGGRVRISLRSKGRVEVHGVATQFGGGGHAFAAGARKRGTLEEVSRLVVDALAGQIRKTLGPDGK